MQDVGVLLLRRKLTIEEAAQLIAAGSGCKPKECEGLLIEAIEDRALMPVHFERFESVDYFNGNPLGPINPMVTTVQRADLDDWCKGVGLALPGRNIGQAGEAAAASAAAAIVDAAKTAASTVHKPARRNALTAVIEKAKANATDGDDWHSVWAELVAMAQSATPETPLIGYAEDGLKYSDEKNGESVQFFTKDALRKRMNPRAR